MGYLVGTDEAGYGPNLGPLVISATVWRVADEALRNDLYATLAECVCADAVRGGDAGRLAIADSKQLYQPGGGLGALECGVLAALEVLGRSVRRWREVWTACDPHCGAAVAAVPWHGDYDAVLPCAIDGRRLQIAARRLRDGLRQAHVELVNVQSRVIFPEEWNGLLDQHHSKGTALSHGTLTLVRDALAALEREPALVVCDKHGGRNRYGPILQDFFPDEFVETRDESRAVSRYRWGPPERRTEVQFVAKGERFLPSALASMTSKYLRELAMAAFNDFWLRQRAGLKPTAGYPQDARRFRDEIADRQRALGIADRQLWRNR